jgi:hypothetical protein
MRSFIERLLPHRRPIIIAIHAGLVVVAYAVTLILDWLLCLALVGGVRLAIPALRKIERNAALPYDVVGFVVEVARATV